MSRVLFRKKMAARHSMTIYLVAPLTPEGQRTAFRGVPLGQRTFLAPERQHRAVNSPTCKPIFCIMLTIDGRRSTIFLANRVDVIRIAQCLNIGLFDLRREGRCRGSPAFK